ncbi:MAG TPA: T9SS type A sorting domain-containing protein [Chitinophagaceae bacterium]|nr:T9SS type A sorting domain-containing protein [Chitinophagaceae bacterium]
MKKIYAAIAFLAMAFTPFRVFDLTPGSIPFSQNWSTTGQITTDDSWAGVPSIIGYRGDDLTTVTATDPQTIVADGAGTPVDVIANQSNPNTQATGGVAEFDGIANPVVALQGSGTGDAPHIVINLNTTSFQAVSITYDLRDIDGSIDNAVQPVALQYRVGNIGSYINIPAGFVADATTGPSLATLVTPVSVILPPAADNQPLVQVRIITTNAIGNDEWFGIDNMSITASVLPVSFGTVRASQQTGGIKIEWTNLTETDMQDYSVERSVDGNSFTGIATVNASSNNGDRTDYSYLDITASAGTSYYRIIANGLNGSKKHSIIVRVNTNGGATDMSIYPNPVTGNQVSLQLTALPKGQYAISVINAGGQQVYSKLLLHTGGAVTEVVQLPATIKTGMYNIRLTGGETNMTKSFIIR